MPSNWFALVNRDKPKIIPIVDQFIPTRAHEIGVFFHTIFANFSFVIIRWLFILILLVSDGFDHAPLVATVLIGDQDRLGARRAHNIPPPIAYGRRGRGEIGGDGGCNERLIGCPEKDQPILTAIPLV